MASQVTTVYTYQLNGVTVDFKIPFDYLSRKFVKVTLLGKDRKVLTFMTDYRFMSPTLIRTTKAWGPSDNYNYIEIRRETSARDLIVDFSDGSILRAGDLNTANLQAMHIAEEARSLAADSLGVDDFGNLDARFRKIVNLGDPVGRKDAVTKAYIDDAKDGVIQSRDKALQYRNEAQRFRNEAESFKNQTNTLKGQAETAKTGAESAKNTAVSKASEASSSATKASQAMASAQGSANNAVTSEKKAKASETAAAGSAKRAEDAAAKAVGGGIPMVNLLQTTGQGTDKVMSQKAVTDLMMPKTGGTFTGNISLKSSGGGEIRLYGNTPDYWRFAWLAGGGIGFSKNGKFWLRLPEKSGTLATNDEFVPKTGGTYNGTIAVNSGEGIIKSTRSGTEAYLYLSGDAPSKFKLRYTPSGQRAEYITFPNKTGTLAIAEDYVPKTGGTFEGLVTVAADGDAGGLKVAGKNIGAYGQLFISSTDSVLKMHHRVQGNSYWSTFPKKTGTLAIAEDYVPKTGGEFSGNISLKSSAGGEIKLYGNTPDYWRLAWLGGGGIGFSKNGKFWVRIPERGGTLAIAGQYKLDDHYKRTRSSIAKSKLSERELRKEIEDLKSQVKELREMLLNVTN